VRAEELRQPTTRAEASSSSMTVEQLDRASNAAKGVFDTADSAVVFVDVIESGGVQTPGRAFTQTAFLPLLIATALFTLLGPWPSMQAPKRRTDFVERKLMLPNWASQLNPEDRSSRSLVASAYNNAAQMAWYETQQFVHSISTMLATAGSVGELDAVEMRFGRTAVKLWDLRRSLTQ